MSKYIKLLILKVRRFVWKYSYNQLGKTALDHSVSYMISLFLPPDGRSAFCTLIVFKHLFSISTETNIRFIKTRLFGLFWAL